jgi:3D (Asp-Asp-Asp) domain-containing protein
MTFDPDPSSIWIDTDTLTISRYYAIIGALLLKRSPMASHFITKETLTLAYNSATTYLTLARKNILTLSKPVTIGVFLLIFSFQMLVPQAQSEAVAQELNEIFDPLTEIFTQTKEFPNTFPESEARPLWSISVPMTAYNSLEGQTDSTPCIAARGYNLCEANEENVVAANFLPIGAKVKIPELFGDREFTVVDRMNARYHYKMDFWMRNYEDAVKFGSKYARVDVYSYK